jgi:CBS domain-containing protein
MTRSLRSCSPFSSVLEAVMIFRDINCGAVPVINAGEAMGILTDRDVALALAEFSDLAHRPVSDIMTEGVLAVSPETLLEDVRAKFVQHAVGRLLVSDSERQVLGIIAWTDLPAASMENRGAPVAHDLAQRP